MLFLAELVIGLVSGVLVKIIVPARAPGDTAATVLLAIVGSFFVGALARTAVSGPRLVASAGLAPDGRADAPGGAVRGVGPDTARCRCRHPGR